MIQDSIMNVNQKATAWKCSRDWVRKLLREGRIDGAFKVEGIGAWLIPAAAVLPEAQRRGPKASNGTGEPKV